MSEAADWPSLAPQLALARQIVGDVAPVSAWLDRQMARCGDAVFGRHFSDHIDLPGVATQDYTHRLLTTPAGTLLGGIRFYGQDVARPFVEVIAHNFATVGDLVACVAGEWRPFAPLHLRLLVAAGQAIATGRRDMSVHLARCGDMARPDATITLRPFADPTVAVGMVTDRFAALRRDDPALAADIAAADETDLADWHRRGHLHAICAGDAAVGLIAAAPGRIEWIAGLEMLEEVVRQENAGHGYAAQGQMALAHRPGTDLAQLLIGTIDALNIASRRSAERAGRRAVLDYAFVPLP